MDMSMPTSIPTATMATLAAGTETTAAPAGTTSAAGMSMGTIGATGNKCKIQMLWNWNTVDACFITPNWQIRDAGTMAVTCIGVVMLVVMLELLRRASKEYDRYIVRRYVRQWRAAASVVDASEKNVADDGSGSHAQASSSKAPLPPACPASSDMGGREIPAYRPSIGQQVVRAFLHMTQFTVAYIIMLLAMYYNGYLLLCIFAGAFIGALLFQWETLSAAQGTCSQEATVCCG